jgi:hypothetical protein
MSSNTSFSRPDSSSSNTSPPERRAAGNANTAAHISPKIVNALAAFIRQTLGLEPYVKAYRTLWECAWLNRAAELTVFLNNEDGEYSLQVIYLEQVMDPPAQRLQSAEIQRLCQQLQAQTGLPTHARI